MSSGKKCQSCGSSEIEVDPSRGDAVCMHCGAVLEDSIIVSEVQFEEGAHGSSSAIGQFVSADSKGGATKFGASFHVGGGVESREVTLRKARNGISQLANQLRLNQHCIDTACSFFKMALARNLTRGRKNTHIHAACVYLTCRTEGTPHLLIDISDVLQICCYELGRTYLKLAQALCINVPSVDLLWTLNRVLRAIPGVVLFENMKFLQKLLQKYDRNYWDLDPCLYILRFASRLEFGGKTQQVTNTALRLVQRMKRDSIHSGRRPSGLCGAALLIAARLHEFNRSVPEIVKVVKVHESTMRKRLVEFGDTPSSALTLEEFMSVDLEEEQDPPAFKAARKKDKERLQRLLDEESESLNEIQKSIETELERNRESIKKKTVGLNKEDLENKDAAKFVVESTRETLSKLIEESIDDPDCDDNNKGLGPNIESMGLANSLDDTSNALQLENTAAFDLTFDDINDEEIDSYIMSENEYQRKSDLWHQFNADFLQKQKEKEEQLKKERDEGKPEKKRKRPARKKGMGPVTSAGEAIEKIIQEKKISSKINYDVLKILNTAPVQSETAANIDEDDQEVTSASIKRRRLSSVSCQLEQISKKQKGRKKAESGIGLPFGDSAPVNVEIKNDVKKDAVKGEPALVPEDEEELEEYYDEEAPQEDTTNEMGVLDMLRQHREDEVGADDDGYDYYEDDY